MLEKGSQFELNKKFIYTLYINKGNKDVNKSTKTNFKKCK